MSEWKVVRSYFLGEAKPESWVGRFRRGDGDSAEEYEVTVRYSGRLEDDWAPHGMSEEIADRDLRSVGIAKGRLRAFKTNMPSCEAIHPAPTHTEYAFALDVGGRVRVKLEHRTTRYDSVPRPILFRPESDPLPPAPRALLNALQQRSDEALADTPMIRLAKALVSSAGPLGPTEVEVMLHSIRAEVNGKTKELAIEEKPYREAATRVPAGIGDSLTLYPHLYVRSLTPMLDRIQHDQAPLPAYAIVRLKARDDSICEYGTAVGSKGEFRIGPVKLTSMRKLRMKVFYPLDPPGDEPNLALDIFLRTGRPIEEYLHAGRALPPPPVPTDLTADGLIPEVVRHVAAAVNPDTGEIDELGAIELSCLSTYGHRETGNYPELQRVLNAACRLTTGRVLLSSAEPYVHPDSAWTEEDARQTLEHPELADDLAKRVTTQLRPRHRAPMTKEDPPLLVDEDLDDTDEDAHRAHALAAAALANANPSKYAELVEKHVACVTSAVADQSISDWPLDDVMQVGQCMKLVARVLAENEAVAGPTAKVLGTMCDDGLRRFKDNSADLPLSQKVSIGHLASPIWQPYLEEASPAAAETAEPPDMVEAPPVQRMELDGIDVTGEVLGEARMMYRAALQRAMETIKASSATRGEKIARMTQFLDDWHAHLFNVHKGDWLQPYEEALKKDLEKALAHVAGDH